MNREKEKLKKRLSEVIARINPVLSRVEVEFELPDWTVGKEAEEVNVFHDLGKWENCSTYCDHPWGPSVGLLIALPGKYTDFDNAVRRLTRDLAEFLAEKWSQIEDIRQERRDQLEAELEGRSLERLREPGDPKVDDL